MSTENDTCLQMIISKLPKYLHHLTLQLIKETFYVYCAVEKSNLPLSQITDFIDFPLKLNGPTVWHK